MIFQILKKEFSNFHYLNHWRENLGEIIEIDNWKNVDKNIPIICSGNLKNENVIYWLKNKFPVLYVARGYVGNHLSKKRKFWRISANGWANIELRKIPFSRWSVLNLPRHSWKTTSIKNILICPSKMTTHLWENQTQLEWAENIKKNFSNCEIKIRLKGSTPAERWKTLWTDLDWADLIIGQSSAITAEAFWYGKKVISTKPCVSWASCDHSLENWDDPTEPKTRDEWHEHLAWSQFHIDEWNSGEAIKLALKYHGDLSTLIHPYNYFS